MKRKFFALLCVAILSLGLLTTALSADTSDTPCLMAINENLLPLENQFIPIAVSGQYYIPYTVLDNRLTEQDLGVYAIYNSTFRTLTVLNLGKTLTFDLAADGSCTDLNGVSYSARVVTRNGRIYIPARFICEYFGLTYSTIVTTYGPMVRIRNSASTMEDSVYVSQARSIIEYRLREWRSAHPSAETPTPSSTLPPTPSTSPAAPSTAPEPTNRSNVRTYLTFRAEQTDGLDSLLEQLAQNRLQALFFFPAEELADYDAAVRKVLCAGHDLGLLADGADLAEVIAQVEEGNRILAQIAHLHTNTVLAPQLTSDQALVDLDAAGILCLSPDVDARPDGRTAYTQANAVLERAEQYQHQMILLSDTSAAGAALMGQVLPALVQDLYDIRPALETDF